MSKRLYTYRDDIPIIDLHGIKHENVERDVENFVVKNAPCKIITGNSSKMKNKVLSYLNEHDYKYMSGDLYNQGYIQVL